MTDAISSRLLNKVLGLSRPTLTLYPVMTGVPATGATLTPGAPGWSALVDIVAAAAILVEFWLLQVQYDTIGGATELYDIEISNATLGTLVFEDHVDTTAVTANIGPSNIPIPVYCNGSDQIQGRAGAAAATVINVSLLTAVGL